MDTTSVHSARLNIGDVPQSALNHMIGFGKLIDESGLDPVLCGLIKTRASQINGCVMCLLMHVQELRKLGVSDDRMHLLNTWRDAPCFSEAEKAALALTDAVTLVAEKRVPDDLYNLVRQHYSAKEYVWLLTTIIAINGWNRLNIGLGVVPMVTK